MPMMAPSVGPTQGVHPAANTTPNRAERSTLGRVATTAPEASRRTSRPPSETWLRRKGMVIRPATCRPMTISRTPATWRMTST